MSICFFLLTDGAANQTGKKQRELIPLIASTIKKTTIKLNYRVSSQTYMTITAATLFLLLYTICCLLSCEKGEVLLLCNNSPDFMVPVLNTVFKVDRAEASLVNYTLAGMSQTRRRILRLQFKEQQQKKEKRKKIMTPFALLRRKRAESEGRKGSLPNSKELPLHHPTDPVELRRLNFQTPGRCSHTRLHLELAEG